MESRKDWTEETGLGVKLCSGRAIAQAVSRWLPTAAVRGSKPDLGMWALWWDKVALGRFSPRFSVSPAIVVRSTNYFTITLMYHPEKMYNRPMCGRSIGTYMNLGDLQRDLIGVKSHPTPPNNWIIRKENLNTAFFLKNWDYFTCITLTHHCWRCHNFSHIWNPVRFLKLNNLLNVNTNRGMEIATTNILKKFLHLFLWTLIQ
jgi:hypothetical protein